MLRLRIIRRQFNRRRRVTPGCPYLTGSLLFGIYYLLFWAGSALAQADVQQLYEEAQAEREPGNLAQAEQKYLEVIRRAPRLATAHHNLGIVYFMEHKYLEAASTLQKAITLSPGLAGAHVMLGLSYYELYQTDKAVAAFQTALRQNPADTNALFYLSKSQIQLHDYSGAEKTLAKLSHLKPRDPDVLYNLSLAYMKLMVETVNRLGEAAPESYQLFLWCAQDAESRNQDSAAAKYYQIALRLKPEAIGLHYALGNVLAREGMYDEAASELKKELELNSPDSLALWKLGELALRSDAEEARGYLEQALQLNPDLPQAVLAYGRALARLGETEKAVEQYRRVILLAPENDSVHYHLADAYRRMGRNDHAKTEMARFEEKARKRSARVQAAAREMIDLSRSEPTSTDQPAPAFSPEHDPTHH